MNAVIRDASPDDAAAIAGVHVTSLRASVTDLLPAHLTSILLPPANAAPRARAWQRWIERERTSTFVSLDGATLTGFCTLHPAPDEGGNGGATAVKGMDRGARADARADAGGSIGAEATGTATAGPCGEIASFYVLPSEWRRGTGRRLGERAVADARTRGFSEVMVWVLETNARARSFYESLRFRPDGESKIFLERPYASWRELRYRRPV